MNNKNKNLNGLQVTLAGKKIWYRNGLKHRLDGPAVIHTCGILEYWMYGSRITESFLHRRKRGEDE